MGKLLILCEYAFLIVFLVLYEINTRRTPIRRVEDNNVNEEIPPQVEKVLQDGQGVQDAQGA